MPLVIFVLYFLYHISFVERDILYHSIVLEGCGNVYIDQHISTKKEQARLVSFCLLLFVLARLVFFCLLILLLLSVGVVCLL